jgi:asparagine synthase (glutamine-hydrolysing)
MSGIVGLITFDGSPVDPRVVETMNAAAPHRSTDGTLAWAGQGAAVMYQRRRVLAGGADERGLAEQDRTICLADARIDNREELISALSPEVDEASGEAEILLASYRRWGEHCAQQVVGDFAFVVWDDRRRMLYAARDPMAMRSLAYWVRPGRSVAFATEVKQLLGLADVPVRLHEPAIVGDLLATFGQPAWTFYDGIASVEPGHQLIVDHHGHRTEAFWRPDPTFRLSLRTERDYADALRDRFVEAVAARLRTDRPAGILLSGGVDSGSAAAASGWLLQRHAVPAPTLRAFSWAFDRLPQCDERAISRLIAEPYGIDQIDVAADDAGPLAGFPDHGPDRDDPFLGAFQPLIEHSLAAARAEGVGVLLGGDRGDLVIGDTGLRYHSLLRTRQWAELRSELREHRRSTSDGWPRILSRHLVIPSLKRIHDRSRRRWLRWTGARRPQGRDDVGIPSWLRVAPAEEAPAEPRDSAEFRGARQVRREWIFTQLHIRGMAWSERTYARFGLAFADPFSDRRIVEWALAVPPVVINRPGDQSKPLMRAAMRGIMPEPARVRVDKVLPSALYEASLRGPAVPIVRELLDHPRLAEHGWVEPGPWRAHYESWLEGRESLRPEWWWALGVEIWLRRFW